MVKECMKRELECMKKLCLFVKIINKTLGKICKNKRKKNNLKKKPNIHINQKLMKYQP